jgi:glycosyltransferase involved in cell wall biosynthesis
MGFKTIFLYSNQPVVRFGNSYFSKYRNFIDFLSYLADTRDEYRLIVPCEKVSELSIINMMYSVHCRNMPIEVFSYSSESLAPFISIINALKIKYRVKAALDNGKVVVCGPGPNSFLVYFSLMLPRSVCYCFIIRGDTLKTVSSIYKGSWRYYLSTGLVRLFRKRIVHLLNKGRAMVFLMGDHLREQYPSHTENVSTIFPLLDNVFVRKDKRPSIHKESPLRFLFVGRLSKEKNIFELIRAIEICTNREKQWKLTIVGTGPLELEVQNRVLNLEDQVKLTGHISDVNELITLYDKNDILCMPSLTEGTPRSVIEAFARGMPVMTTAIGSLPRLFSKEIRFLTGYSAEIILEGMRWCEEHRQEMTRMGLAGQKKISRFLIRENALFLDRLIGSFLKSTQKN